MNLILSIFLMFITPVEEKSIIELAKTKHKEYKVTKPYVVIVDYRKSIDDVRLFVVDVNKDKIVMQSIVAHGINSGLLYAKDFSNQMNTKKSSYGAYVTTYTYFGMFGYSLKLRGLDKGINDNAEKRAIIFHSTKNMRTKWSWGCFATPESVNTILIDKIKNGSLIYVIK